MWGIKLPFTSKNPFVILSFHAKVMDKFQRKGMTKNRFLQVKVNLIYYKSLVEFSLEKVYLSCVNEI
jgi:hypothetical protein